MFIPVLIYLYFNSLVRLPIYQFTNLVTCLLSGWSTDEQEQ